MVVDNKTKKVIVLKAMNKAPLRLFPGHNNIDAKNLDAYTDGNEAAISMLKENCAIVEGADVNKTEAMDAQKKNDKLNKASKNLKKVQMKLLEAEEASISDKNMIKELIEKVNALEEKLADKKDKKDKKDK
ncbi:MAG: hypothetical protein GY861_24465 [bacterium]|nr:hypothetical protein [bacterium]